MGRVQRTGDREQRSMRNEGLGMSMKLCVNISYLFTVHCSLLLDNCAYRFQMYAKVLKTGGL